MSSDLSHCLETQAEQTDSENIEAMGCVIMSSENYSVTPHGAVMSQMYLYQLECNITVFRIE